MEIRVKLTNTIAHHDEGFVHISKPEMYIMLPAFMQCGICCQLRLSERAEKTQDETNNSCPISANAFVVIYLLVTLISV